LNHLTAYQSLAQELIDDLDGLSDEETGDAGEDATGEDTATATTTTTNGNGKRSAISPLRADQDDVKMDQDDQPKDPNQVQLQDGQLYVPTGGVRPADELDAEAVEGFKLEKVLDVRKVAPLTSSKRMKDVLEGIDEFLLHPKLVKGGSLADNPEYDIIVKANNLAVEVDNELLIVHKFVRDHYHAKFPGLDTLVPEPTVYLRVVQAIGNLQDISQAPLKDVVKGHTIMVITVSATTADGRQLSHDEWHRVDAACQVHKELEDAKRKIFEYVQSRMNILSPNVSAIVGTTTAAKLIGVAGGLQALAKMPSCNVYLLGAMKKTPTGQSTATMNRHTGFIFQSDLVQSCEPEHKLKAQRTVSGKVVLAARVDLEGGSKEGNYGDMLRTKLEKHFEKMAEPPPLKVTKALPVPSEDGKKKRRGGRRARKAKEAYGMTELRQLSNRVKFGEQEQETDAFGGETRGLGMLGKESGKLRASAIDSKSRAKMSKQNKIRTQLLGGPSKATSGTATSGTASSLSITPFQGIELANPNQNAENERKLKAANDKWFAKGAFTHIPQQGDKLPGSK
ncbi:hypothetical protein E3P92_01910, partial [Wallemia ichthyophaga]